jgi:hypothetical protein
MRYCPDKSGRLCIESVHQEFRRACASSRRRLSVAAHNGVDTPLMSVGMAARPFAAQLPDQTATPTDDD